MAYIEYPGVHDVLCGRGGHAISHAGNVSFRMLVEKYRDKYVVSSRYEKAQVTGDIVRMWRAQTPPGRFLIMTDPSKRDSSRWHDIGDLAANKKVAQSLREKKTRNDNESGRSDRESDSELPPLPPAATAPTSAVAVMPYATPSNHPEEWKQRKLQQQQRKLSGDSKGNVAHQQQHPKHQTQRQLKRQQNAFKKQMQKQVEQAEQEVMLAQQQVNQQAQHLQTALILRAQQEAAAAAAQVQMNQIAIQKAQEEILKGQAQAQQQQQQQQQQLLQQQQWIQQHQLVQQQIQQQQVQQQQNQLQQQQIQQQEPQVHQAMLEGPCDTSVLQQQQMQEEEPQDHQAILEGPRVDSPIMWGDSQEGTDNPLESRDSIAQAMPSARCLTKNVFDYEPTNGSSDSSTAPSVVEASGVSKLLYSQLDSFSDTTSEQSSNEGADNGDSGAMSDGCSSVAKSSFYPPD